MAGVDPHKHFNDIVRMLSEDAPGTGGEPKNSSSHSNTPTLNQFGRDLTELARDGKFDPIIRRDKKIKVIQI